MQKSVQMTLRAKVEAKCRIIDTTHSLEQGLPRFQVWSSCNADQYQLVLTGKSDANILTAQSDYASTQAIGDRITVRPHMPGAQSIGFILDTPIDNLDDLEFSLIIN